jgi:uncharacterized protein YbbC (DUF1343 family)
LKLLHLLFAGALAAAVLVACGLASPASAPAPEVSPGFDSQISTATPLPASTSTPIPAPPVPPALNLTASSTSTPSLAPTPPSTPAPAPRAGAEAIASDRPARVQPGIETLVNERPELIAGKRVGLITNPTGVASDLRSDVDLIASVPDAKLVALFAGEHGVWGAEDAGKKLEGSVDPHTRVPVYSLYGSTLRPRAEWLRDIDVLLFDIQNSGSSLYTYKFTMSFAMEAAARAGIPFLVLDRPNPAGGAMVEGPMMRANDIWRHPLPVRHGMTNGELAAMWNEEYRLGANLKVVEMKGWRRDMTWDETGLPWVLPSPNIPTADTALAYAGQGLVESVGNVAEGRGTTKPFLITGAPWVNGVKAAADLNTRGLPGVAFRPAYFVPTKPGEKFYGQMAGGVEIYFTDRKAYRAVDTFLSIMDAYARSASPSVEVRVNGPVRLLEPGESLEARVAGYQRGITDFLKVRERYLLY